MSSSKEKRILIGIAAMEKKARSKPMKEIMRRFDPKLFEFVIFGDEVLLNAEVADWPIVDYLFAWYSNNYPLDKAKEYVSLRKVACINDVNIQHQLMDRRQVYKILQEVDINVPRHVVLNEEERIIPDAVRECDDWIEIKGVRFTKPVVEKPVDAEDHNIYIYYPLSAGGGSKRLFRKVGSKSSEFYPEVNELRKEGSYIYEEFIETQGVDVKVYTVGPNYGHAEARKSPVIDGKVQRNKDGSETRYPVLLSAQEKVFANKVVMAFKQGVCGFDILRVHSKSYVCDVNGWSFVKTSSKYFDDCATLLSEIVRSNVTHKCLESLSAVGPLTIGNRLSCRHASLKDLTIEPQKQRKRRFSMPSIGSKSQPTSFRVVLNNSKLDSGIPLKVENVPSFLGDIQTVPTSPTIDIAGDVGERIGEKGHMEGEELRCVICVIRHGDRTPKQKLKFVIKRGDETNAKGLLCPYFAFFHAFLDADIAADKVYHNRQNANKIPKGNVTAPNGEHKPSPGSTAAAVAAVAKALSIKDEDNNSCVSEQDHRAYSQELLTSALEVASSSLAEKLSAASGDGLTRAQGATIVSKLCNEPEGETRNSNILQGNIPPSTSLVPLKSLETLFDVQDLKPGNEEGSCSSLPAYGQYVAPNRKEIKVRSKEGLKSFLLTTENILENLLRAIKEAKNDDTEGFPDVLGMDGTEAETLLFNLLRVQDVLNRGSVSGISGKLQLKALSWAPVDINSQSSSGIIPMKATSIEVIVKWGGALTPLGEAQAQYLGETLRKSLYPDPEGGGVLRLHSTFRHDLKIKTSDEGRVMQTAASFAKGLLQLEGPLTPILVSLVRKEKGSLHMLDNGGNVAVKDALDKCKKELHRLIHISGPLSRERLSQLAPAGNASVRNALTRISNPTDTLKKLHDAVGVLVGELDELLLRVQKDESIPTELYMRETLLLLVHRWRKLHKDFHKPKKSDFDLSKVPDILDAIRYDLEHNKTRLQMKNGTMERVYRVARDLGEAYVPQEYGIGSRTKLLIGTKMCSELLKKIRNDLILGTSDALGGKADMQYLLDTSHAANLDVKSLGRHVRTRLYFTSETHLHTLLNVLRFGHLKHPGLPNNLYDLKPVIDEEGESFISNQSECCYLTHIVIRVFENLGMPKSDPSRFRVELSFSPGANREPINLDCEKNETRPNSQASIDSDVLLAPGSGSRLQKSYFENHPSDAEEDESRLQVATAQLLNKNQPSTAADLEQYLEAAIKIAESSVSFQTPRLSPQPSDQRVIDELGKKDKDKEKNFPSNKSIPTFTVSLAPRSWLFFGVAVGITLFTISRLKPKVFK